MIRVGHTELGTPTRVHPVGSTPRGEDRVETIHHVRRPALIFHHATFQSIPTDLTP